MRGKKKKVGVGSNSAVPVGLAVASSALPLELSPTAPKSDQVGVVRACVPGDELCGRESIFSIPHTNEFSGTAKLAPEPTRACWRVIRCRRDYERAHGSHGSRGLPRFPAVVCPVGFGLGGAVRLAEHLVPRRKLPLKSEPFSALFRASGPVSSLYSASCGP